jgi:hypothetical protein
MIELLIVALLAIWEYHRRMKVRMFADKQVQTSTAWWFYSEIVYTDVEMEDVSSDSLNMSLDSINGLQLSDSDRLL